MLHLQCLFNWVAETIHPCPRDKPASESNYSKGGQQYLQYVCIHGADFGAGVQYNRGQAVWSKVSTSCFRDEYSAN